jgi:hypothetical protein
MTRRLFFATAAVFRLAGADKKRAQDKGPEIQVVEISAYVEERRVKIDARLKNSAERPVRGLTVILEILDGDSHVLTRQQGPIDEPVLEPGEESVLRMQIHYHARAVSLRVLAEDSGGRELRIGNAGPFPIE